MTTALNHGATRRQLQRLLTAASNTTSGRVSTTTGRHFSSLMARDRIADTRAYPIPRHQRRTRRLGEGLMKLHSRSQQQQQLHSLSTLTSNSFWKSLNDAVEHGDGATAQEIVDQVVQEYKNRLRNGPPMMTVNGTKRAPRETLDTRMFSMVLQAWKNESSISVDSAMRAQKLLQRMIVLEEKGLVLDKPTIDDYLSVLECWSRASAGGAHENCNTPEMLKHVGMIWEMVQQQEEQIPLAYQGKLYQVYMDILANAGRGQQAEECLEEYKQQLLIGNDSNIKRADNVVVDMGMCLSVLRGHVRSPETRSMERAEEFLRTMRDDTMLPNPDTAAYNIVLDGWISIGKADYATIANRVESLLAEMKQMRVQPNAASYQYGLEILARNGEGPRAEALLTSLLKEYTNQFDADLKPDIGPFRTVLLAYSNCHHPDAASHAESVLKNMSELSQSEFDTQPTTFDHNLVLKCWAQSRSPDSVERAMKIYGEMLSVVSDDDQGTANPDDLVADSQLTSASPGRNEVLPDAISLNTVLNISSKHERAHQTEKLLWKFFDRHFQDPSRNPCPDTVSFCTVMQSWSRARDRDAPERAEKLLKKLEELYQAGNENCKPDLFSYSILMNCWVRAIRARKEAPMRAVSILRRLQEISRNGSDMSPDAACWNLAISAWLEDGERAEALFMEMIENYRNNPSTAPSPNAKTLTKVFHAWAKTRSRDASDRSVALLDKVTKLHEEGVIGIKPHMICHSLVLEAFSQDRSFSSAISAEEMLREMTASRDPAMRPNVTCYNWVIKTWSFAAHPEAVSRVTALLEEVIRQSVRNEKMMPNAKTFGGVLKTLAESNLPDKRIRAEAVVALMDKFGCQPDRWIQNVLNDIFAGNSGARMNRNRGGKAARGRREMSNVVKKEA